MAEKTNGLALWAVVKDGKFARRCRHTYSGSSTGRGTVMVYARECDAERQAKGIKGAQVVKFIPDKFTWRF